MTKAVFEGVTYNVRQGTNGKDTLVEGLGNDWIRGGAGNDTIIDLLGNNLFDGGSGSDTITGGIGKDIFIHRMSENVGAKDRYEGAIGTDTLRLELTAAEWARADVQADIAAFLAHTATTKNKLLALAGLMSDFSFTSMDLKLSNIERLEVYVDGVELDPKDDKVKAVGETLTVSSASAASIDLLANDTVPDRVASISLGSFGSAYGGMSLVPSLAGVTQTATLTFTPNAAYAALKAGETKTETVTYTIRDVDGDTGTATATIKIVGVNDAPVVAAEGRTVDEQAAGAVVATFTVTDVDTAAGLTFRVLKAGAVDPRFEVVPAGGTTAGTPGAYEVRLKAGVALDFQQEPSLSLTIEANDGQAANAIGGSTVAIEVRKVAPTYTITASNSSVAEGNSAGNTITYTVIRSGDGGQTGEVAITLSGDAVEGRDYVVSGLSGGTLAFAQGATTASFTVTTVPDHLVEANRSITATVGSSTTVSSTVLIRDDDRPNSYNLAVQGSNNPKAISADGTKILFVSSASNLVANDTNGQDDLFVKDLQTGEITPVATRPDGFVAGRVNYFDPAFFSSDGTKVLFASYASDLVASDTNGDMDVFVKDLTTGTVQLASSKLGQNGTTGNSFSYPVAFSPDGNTVLFYSEASDLVANDTNGTLDAFVKDLTTGTVQLVASKLGQSGTTGNGHSYPLAFSPDGTKVLFYSEASDLVPSDTNGRLDAFVKDLTTGTVQLVSSKLGQSDTIGNGSSYPVAFSPDGTKVLFYSDASDLVPSDTNGTADAFVKDLTTGTVQLVSSKLGQNGTTGNSYSYPVAFSPDGTKVLFFSSASDLVPSDTNGRQDAFVKDLTTGTVQLCRVSSAISTRPVTVPAIRSPSRPTGPRCCSIQMRPTWSPTTRTAGWMHSSRT